ncbi:putative general transcription factor 3C polypeptide 5-like isoform X1 [Capsicum annuum]|nr:putative general transcription factor 3C polypeptide 5-like isoform X1 [Capsicum annuum]
MRGLGSLYRAAVVVNGCFRSKKTVTRRRDEETRGLGPISYPIHNPNPNPRPNTDPKSVSFDEVSKLFNLPLSDAAQSLGVCASVLKKICYENGLVRWPYRKSVHQTQAWMFFHQSSLVPLLTMPFPLMRNSLVDFGITHLSPRIHRNMFHRLAAVISGKSIEDIKKEALREKQERSVEFPKAAGERNDSLASSAILSFSCSGLAIATRWPRSRYKTSGASVVIAAFAFRDRVTGGLKREGHVVSVFGGGCTTILTVAFLVRGGRGRREAREDRLRVGSWNIGTLQGKSVKLVKILKKRRINIACVQETKWVGLEEEVKASFWEALDEVVRSVPSSEKIVIAGDFNGHFGVLSGGYDYVHGGFGFSDRNGEGAALLDFARAFGLVVVNSSFPKKEDHLSFRSAITKTQIDFLLLRKGDRALCKDCKVIPSEHVLTQRRLLVMDLVIKKSKKRTAGEGRPRIKWGGLTPVSALEMEKVGL